jgi:hypothetical protein
MKNYEIVNSDNFNQSNFTENFSDLINNNNYFNSTYDEAKLICLDNYKDNSDYSSYPSLEDIIKNYDHTTDKDKTFVCTVEDKQIWTSDFSKGGYDRLTKVSDQTCRENLNQKIYGSDEPKGFDDNDAGTLNGVLRYLKDETGKIFLVLVKNMGNHRFWMKKLANRGKKINLLFKIKFHDLDKNLNKDDFITIESDAHHSDADDRQSQNETQKFMSGFRAKRKELVDCFNYLKTVELEYEGIMQLEKVENANNWPSLTSIMGFNKGQGNGIFKKFGDTNVNAAIGTAKEIVKITKENLIHNSAIWCLASMFKSLTEIYGDSKTSYSLFTKKELRDFFIEYFKENNRQSKFRRKSLTLSDLVQTQGIKDYNFINCDVFWRDGAIVQYFLQLKDRKTGFTYNHPCMQHLLGQITPILRKTAMSLVSA